MVITKKTILRVGSTETENIKILQNRLKILGLYKYKVDGDFGQYTKAAVIAFQRAKGLVRDGIAGPITNKALGIIGVSPVPTGIKGAIQLAVEKKLGTFASFTGYYNKMIGRGYSHYLGDAKTLAQEEATMAYLNCSDATQVSVFLAREMGYTAKFVHVKCPQSGEGHVYGMISGKEFGAGWTKFDVAAAMSVGTKARLGTGWCFSATPISYNDPWLESDDGKT